MELPITDSDGQKMLLSTSIHSHSFDAVTCSPSTRGGFGFSLLYQFLDRPYSRPQVEAACFEAVSRNEVCVLPTSASSKWRVLITPTIRSREAGTRQEAARLMMDLFAASQADSVVAKALLITHFHHAIAYPEPHIAGIFDAISKLAAASFRGLKVLGFDFTRHREQFERQARERFQGDADCRLN